MKTEQQGTSNLENSSPPVVIRVTNLSVEYVVHDYKFSTLKELVMNRIRGKAGKSILQALKGVNATIRKGESVALLGHNGCGKSTLLKSIAGVLESEFGEVLVHGRIAPMIELGAGFDGELSGRENIMLSCMLMGLSREEVNDRLSSIIQFSGLSHFIDIPFKNYSSGMQARLGFACATSVDPDVLLIDEVLAVGDANFAKKCMIRMDELKRKGTTIVFVSHDANTARMFCKRGIVMEKGQVLFDGPINEALAFHEDVMAKRYLDSLSEEERAEIQRLEKLKKDVSSGNHGLTRPVVNSIVGSLKQNGDPVDELDVSHPFEIEILVSLDRCDLIESELSVGIGWNTASGLRVGGYNNLIHQLKIPTDHLHNNCRLTARFSFERGFAALAPGVYSIVCGVHDQSISRNIWTGPIASVRTINGDHRLNADGDILSFAHFISGLDISIS